MTDDKNTVHTPKTFSLEIEKIAFDKSYKESLIKQINEKSSKFLFNDKEVYKEYITIFNKAIEEVLKS